MGRSLFMLSLSVDSGWEGFNRTSVVISKKIGVLRKNSGIFYVKLIEHIILVGTVSYLCRLLKSLTNAMVAIWILFRYIFTLIFILHNS